MAGGLTLFHAPNTRSSGTMLMLDEIGAEYDLQVLDFGRNEQLDPRFLAINPMGKVPALLHDGAVVTEQVAILIYLADLFPAAKLAPPIGHPDRGPFLRWMVYYSSCFEPALIDTAMKRDPGPRRMVPYADRDTMFAALTSQLSDGPWFLGASFSALDVLWGMALSFTKKFGILPDNPTIDGYITRFAQRPSVAGIIARDADLAAAQKARSG